MFTPRTTIVENVEVERQKEIQSILLQNNKPSTVLQKKAASLVNHHSINPIVRSKILKRFNELLETFFYSNDLVDNVNENDDIFTRIDKHMQSIKTSEIRKFVKSTPFEIGDELFIPLKPKTIQIAKPLEMKSYMNVMLKTEPISMTSLIEFESIMFNNRIRYRYLENTKFPEYLFYNLLYALDVNDIEELEGNQSWQARLALLLNACDLNERVAERIFYDDKIEYLGNYYDVSYVPKYDVKNLTPQKALNNINVIKEDNDTEKLINYYNNLDVRNTSKVPSEFMSIFLVFPFKDGHYIQPNGDIVFINKFKSVRKSAKFVIRNSTCNVGDFETAIDDASRSVTLDEAIYYALYTDNLNELALALMVLRRLIGSILDLNGHKIYLADELALIYWIKFTCSPNQLLLPKYYKSKDSEKYLQLIRNITQSCCTKLGCAIICSSYYLPEMNYNELYAMLKTNGEKYTFFTLIIQMYPMKIYIRARENLKNPQFDSLNTFTHNPKLFSSKQCYDTTLSDHLTADSSDDGNNVELIRPTDINDSIPYNQQKCPPYKCSEYYEFANEQLLELAKTGNYTEPNDVQVANYITLLIDRNLN
jgi:hypothetical protein